MTTEVDPATLLDRALGDVPAPARARLLECAELVEFTAGDRIAAEGEPAEALHVVVAGTVQLAMHQRQADLCVATLGPGDLLGWSWLVPPHRWQFDATTPRGATLWRVPADELRSAMAEEPEVEAALATTMLSVLSRRLRDTRLQLLDLFSGDGSDHEP